MDRASGGASSHHHEAEPRNDDDDTGDRRDRDLMFFLRIDVQGPDVGHRLGLRIGEVPEQERACADDDQHDAKQSEIAHGCVPFSALEPSHQDEDQHDHQNEA